LDSVLRKSDGVIERSVNGHEYLVPYQAEQGEPDAGLFGLNRSAGAIWALFDGKRTVGEIARELRDVFDVSPGVLEPDVLEFARDLAERHMIDLIDDTSSQGRPISTSREHKGRVLRVKHGYNPNSSSLGTVIFAIPAAIAAFSVASTGIAGALLAKLVDAPATRHGSDAPPDKPPQEQSGPREER
jgi:hypothetical protein